MELSPYHYLKDVLERLGIGDSRSAAHGGVFPGRLPIAARVRSRTLSGGQILGRRLERAQHIIAQRGDSLSALSETFNRSVLV